MTKWFDTNYHYMVPELASDQRFTLASRKPIEEYRRSEGARLSDPSRAGRPGHVPELAKSKDAGFDPLSLLDRLLPVYVEVLRDLPRAAPSGCRSTSRASCSTSMTRRAEALQHAYASIRQRVPQLKIMLATYFGGLGDNLDTALALPVPACISISCARRSSSTTSGEGRRGDRVLSLGVIDGRNVWRADLSQHSRPARARRRQASAGDRVQIAPSARCCTCRSISRWKPTSIPT